MAASVASPLVFVSLESGQKIADRFRGIISKVLALFPSLKYNLRTLGIMEVEAYVAASLASSLLLALMFGGVAFAALQQTGKTDTALRYSLVSAIAIFTTFFIFNIFYPGIRTKTVAGKIDRDLMFALKDMLMQVESGIPLYEAMVNISRSSYGLVSSEFGLVVKEISGGTPETVALQRTALKTKSEFFRKALWQLISSMEKGARLGPALRSVIETMENYTYKSIKDYSGTLNFVVLIYMLTAAAIPSLGITFFIVLSAFGGMGVDERTIAMIVGSSLVAQMVLIGFVNSGRPAVYE